MIISALRGPHAFVMLSLQRPMPTIGATTGRQPLNKRAGGHSQARRVRAADLP